MKKIFLITALLVCSVMFSQSTTFVRKYDNFVTKIDGVESEVQPTSVTAVFNEGGKNTIVVYINGNVHRYFQVSEPKEDVTNNGSSYQIIEAVRESDGSEVSIQLFENNLRLIIGGSYIEFL